MLDDANASPPGPAPTDRPAPRGFGLSVDAFGRLVLIDADGRRHIGVEPIRLFPLTHPQGYISLCDAEGSEIAFVDDLATLPPATRKTLEEELARREFVPVITRVRRIDSTTTPMIWEVETDRGEVRFTLNTEDLVRILGPHRVLITDDHGQRYHIPDVRALDATSRRLIERYL